MFPNVALAVLFWASSIGASTLQLNNYCADSVWITLTNPTEPYTDPLEVKSGEAYGAGTSSGEGSA